MSEEAADPAGLLAVLDYGIGNLRSAEKALVHLGAPARLVTDPADVGRAAGVVLPGVGAFGRCAAALHSTGLGAAACSAVAAGVPFLGICVGFQLLYEGSEEDPGAEGLGVLPGVVRKLAPGRDSPDGPALKVPQMQWNRLDRVAGTDSGLLSGLDARPWVYFVHSYAPEVGPQTVATCGYGGPVAAAAESGNVWGTQFHPEKSGRTGLAILENFVARCRIGQDAGRSAGVPSR